MKNSILLIIGMLLSYCLAFATDAPSNLSPSNGAINQQVAITLDWSGITGNTGYIYQVDTTSSFDSPLFLEANTSTDNSQAYISSLYFGTKYYWRAAAKTAIDTSVWSISTSFTTIPSFVNTSPSNGSVNQPTEINIDWNGITGNSGYIYEFDTVSTFDSPYLLEGTSGVNSSNANVYNLYFGTTYYWRAAAKNLVDTSNWSSTWNFTTIDQIYNTSPSDGATNQYVSLNIDWDAVTGNTGYLYKLDTSSNFDSPILYEENSGINASNSDINNLLFGTTYYWTAAAKNSIDTSLWTIPWSFTTINSLNLTSPTNGATNQNVTPTLDWSTMTGNSGYLYQLDTSLNFNSPLVINGTTATNVSETYVSNLYFGTKYYWRAAAKNTVDTTEWSATWSFTTLSTVNNWTPSNGAINQNTTLFIQWYDIVNDNGYMYQVDTSQNFNSPLFEQGTTATDATQKYLTDLFFGTTYYWRACAKNANDTSEWSTTWSFTTLSTVNNWTPSNGAINQNTALFIQWDDIVNDNGYMYQIDTSQSFNSPLFDQGTTATDEANKYLTDLLFGTTYYWRACAKNANDTSIWTSTWSFTTISSVSNVSPSNLATNISINPILDWSNIIGNTGYLCEIDTALNFDSALQQEYTSATNISQTNVSGLLYGTTYYWHAAAKNAVDTSSWSPTWSFTTAYELTEAPVLVSPTNESEGISFPSVSVEWLASTGAVTYQYQYSTDENFINGVISNTSSLITSSCTGLYPHTVYYWRVRGANANGYSPWSTVWQFTTESADLVPPVLVSPANDAISISIDNIVLDWNSVFGASGYIFEITEDINFISGITTQMVTETYKTIIGLAYGTQYYWRVKSTDGVVESDWSEVWNFTTELNELEMPVLVSPANLSTDIDFTSVTLDWNSVTGASQYVYIISTDNNFDTYLEMETVIPTQVTILNLEPNTQYFWKAKSSNGIIESDWTAIWNFTTIVETLEAPVLISPINNSTGVDVVSITLDWAEVTDALEYTYEYSTDLNFVTDVITETISGTEKTILSFIPNTQYYWRVKAINGTVESNWSEVWNFTTEPLTQYTLTITSSYGSVFVDGAEYFEPIIVNGNTILNLFAQGNIDFPFAFWTGDVTGDENPTTILMDADKFVTAEYVDVNTEEFTSNKQGISIYPNPSNGIVNIEASNMNQIKIFDITGKLIFENSEISNHYTINLEGYSNGIYVIEVISESGIYKEKIIIE